MHPRIPPQSRTISYFITSRYALEWSFDGRCIPHGKVDRIFPTDLQQRTIHVQAVQLLQLSHINTPHMMSLTTALQDSTSGQPESQSLRRSHWWCFFVLLGTRKQHVINELISCCYYWCTVSGLQCQSPFHGCLFNPSSFFP
jgi:hypothetical protein